MEVTFYPRKNKDYAISVDGVPTPVTFNPSEVRALDGDGIKGVHVVASTLAHRLYCRHMISYDMIDTIQDRLQREINWTLGTVHEWSR